ncbi:MAG TPA: arsenic resistance N-acetyltransferase ArsN2 [Chitinophagaceae bacterium]|nr:arsenic resistance N-acetyltransferase ArsN2 [Chitinophagaceae bacterium]
MTNTLLVLPAESKYSEAIREILRNEKLPVEDISPDLENFFMATDNGIIVGCIGLETYGRYGFLRSLAIRPEYRKMKIAGELIKKLEMQAKQSGLLAIYLLTEAAEGYFVKKGFTIINREEMPNTLQQSSEFTHTCPQSAIAMMKNIQ